MAYPTVAYKHVGTAAGAQPISEASSTQLHRLGQEVVAVDATYGEGRFVYCKGVASTAPGDLCAYESDTGTTTRAVAGGGASTGPVAVAMSVCDSTSKFGWYQVEGAGPVNAATVSDNTALYLTATAGQVDDLASSGELVDGLRAKAATSGDFATCQLNRPNVTGIASTGTNSGDVTIGTFGASPTAKGMTITGQAINLEPASATHPGAMLAADKAKLDVLANALYCTLSAAAEAGDAIVVTGQVKDATGENVAEAKEVFVQLLSEELDNHTPTVTSGNQVRNVGLQTSGGEIISTLVWITTTAAGAFAFSVSAGGAEQVLVKATPSRGLTELLKITFAA